MRKALFVLMVVLILVIGMLIPWIVGIEFERTFLSLVAEVNQDSRIQISILEYKRGWLHSHARLKLAMAKDDLLPKTNPAKPLTFLVNEKINHGPILYDSFHHGIHFGYALIQSFFYVAEKINNTLPENQLDAGFMQAQAVSKFNGRWIGHIHIPTLNISTPFGKINLMGLDSEYRIRIRDNLFRYFYIETQAATLSLKIDPQINSISQITVQPMKFKFDILHDRMGLWSGNASLFVPGVSLRRSDGKSYSTDKLIINNRYGMRNGIIYETNLSFITYNLKTPSSNMQLIPKLQIWLSANNLNGMIFYDHFADLIKWYDTELKNFDLKILEQLLSQSFSVNSLLNSEISAATQHGNFNLKTTTKLQPNSPDLTSFWSIVNNSVTTGTLAVSTALAIKIIKIYDEAFLNTTTIGEVVDTDTSKNVSTQTTNGEFDNLIVQLLKQDKIKIQKAVEILELEKNNFPLHVFSTKLDALGLPTNVADQLKRTYESSVMLDPDVKIEDKDIRTTIISDKAAQQLISDLLQIGGIRKGEDNTYNTAITISDGMVKFNGWKIN